MIDAALLADLRRLVNTLLLQERLPEWQRDLAAAVPDKAVKDLVNDFRRGPPPAGEEVQRGTGWTEPPKVDQWKPPGLEHMDRMMDAQDAIDRAARARELIEATAIQRAQAELKAQQMGLNREDWANMSEKDIAERKAQQAKKAEVKK